MGITNLMTLLRKQCPDAIKPVKLKNYSGKKFACDASMV
jgi:hypothetical protein